MEDVKTAQRACVAAVLAMLGVCGSSTAQDRPIREVLTGVWDWEAAPKRCQDSPHSIKFTPGGMELGHLAGATIDNQPPQAITIYRILDSGPDVLRMQIIGETRTTARGDLVVWDLKLLSPDAYCWRRTDWPVEGCTGRVVRCPPRR